MGTRIRVVEDEPAIQEIIAFSLRRRGYEVERAGDAGAAARIVAAAAPDAILLDWMLPGESGLAFARQLRAQAHTREIPLVMITARSADEDRILGIEAGADDYVTKPFSPRDPVARVAALLRRGNPDVGTAPRRLGALLIDPQTRRVCAGERTLALTATEFRLLYFLMSHPGHVHRRRHLLAGVWGDDVTIEERSIDVHIRRLRARLARIGCEAMIETVRGSGYRICAEATTLAADAVVIDP